ncbi:hypothetical protein [Streptomyces abikoensis]|uniref:hypothetical protein n=1 Tax=Streptomyces abikoensis TaxID=97398 RepID=UPI0033CC815A
MPVLTPVHTHFTFTHRRGTGRVFLTFLTFLATVARRIADSPLDSTVLRTLPGATPAPRPAADERAVRPHAHWHAVTGPDGRRHLEAVWHLTH